MPKYEPDQPRAYDINIAAKIAGIGRTRVYDEIRAGRLRAVKSGKRTLILASDLDTYLASLPAIEPTRGAA